MKLSLQLTDKYTNTHIHAVMFKCKQAYILWPFEIYITSIAMHTVRSAQLYRYMQLNTLITVYECI